MATAAAAAPDNNRDLKALAGEIGNLIRMGNVGEAIEKFQAESNDDRYAILIDLNARVLHWGTQNSRVDLITTMLAGLNTAQCTNALFNEQHGT